MVQFVNDVLARQNMALEGQKRADSFPMLLSGRILADAERDATNLRLSAKAEAERLVVEAQHQAEKIITDARSQAKSTAEEDANGILRAATEKAELAETQALQAAHLFLVRAREEIQEQVASDAKEVYDRLLSSLHDLQSTASDVDAKWNVRKIEPVWGRPLELKDYQAVMMDSLTAGQPHREALPGQESGSGLQSQPGLAEETASSTTEIDAPAVVEPNLEVQPGIAEEAGSSPTVDVPTSIPLVTSETITETPVETQPENAQEDSAQPEGTSPLEPPRAEVQPTMVPEPIIQLAGRASPEPTGEATLPNTAVDLLPQPEAVMPIEPRGEEAQTDAITEVDSQPETASAPEPLADALQEIISKTQEEQPLTRATSQEGVSPETITTVTAGGTRLYAGEVDLVITPPVSADRITTLYSHLQSIPEIKVLRTAGSWDRGTVVTIATVAPVPLVNLLSDIPALEVEPGAPENFPVKGVGEKGKTNQWISITFKTQDSPDSSDSPDAPDSPQESE
ncbi:MAG: hypothetical protein V3S37_07020 [Dehalococcoidia bacterium]